MKRILFIVSSASQVGTTQQATGYEFSEVADPYLAFVEAGYTVDFASPAGGRPAYVNYHADQPASKAFKEGPGFAHMNQSRKLADVAASQYDAMFFPGGLAPTVDLATDSLTKQLIAGFYESGKVVGAVCHGPVALLGVTLADGKPFLAGKRVTSFTAAEEAEEGNPVGTVIPFFLDDALRNEGAVHSSVFPFGAHVEVDERLVTGQNPASATPVAQAMIHLLEAE